MLSISAENVSMGRVDLETGLQGDFVALTLTDTVTNATFTASQAINIPSTVGATTAYVGFTAGTGGSIATQNVLTWTYVAN